MGAPHHVAAHARLGSRSTAGRVPSDPSPTAGQPREAGSGERPPPERGGDGGTAHIENRNTYFRFSMYALAVIRRDELLHTVRKALRESPVVALLGPRQCGKTTLARQIAGRSR